MGISHFSYVSKFSPKKVQDPLGPFTLFQFRLHTTMKASTQATEFTSVSWETDLKRLLNLTRKAVDRRIEMVDNVLTFDS